MKVFIVEEHGWEHGDVVAVFSTREAADAFMADRLTQINECDVHEYEVDRIPTGYPLRRRKK